MAEIDQPIWFSVFNWLMVQRAERDVVSIWNPNRTKIQVEQIRGEQILAPNNQVLCKRPPDLQADWGDLLTGSQQRRHTHRGTCAHATP